MARPCRSKSGRFKKCGSGSSRRRAKKGKSCRFGKSKTTGKCLKHRRKR